MTEPDKETVLFLHIGTGKAGSSTIQDHLRLLEDPALGVLPIRAFGFPNAVNLVAASKSGSAQRFFVQKHQSMTPDFFSKNAEKIWEDTRSEVAISPVRNFVASSEFLSSLVRGDNIAYLRDRLFTCFDRVEIIIYLREQCSYLRSLWGQSVKGPGRSCRSFADFVNDLEKTPHIWDYSLLIRDWQQAFGDASLKVCVFDKLAFHEGDLVSDFCHKINVPRITDGGRVKKRKNVSPGFEELEAIRRKNIMRNGSIFDRCFASLRPQQTVDQKEYEAHVIRLTSPGNNWINQNLLSSQAVKLPVS